MMRRLLLLAAAFAAAATAALAQDDPPKWLEGGEPQSGWRYVFSPTDWEAVFIVDDEMFLEQWPLVTVWSRHEFRQTKEGDAYSTLALLQYDCSREGKAEYARYQYDKPLLKGPVEQHLLKGDKPSWDYPPPGDGMRDFIRHVCTLAREERAKPDPIAALVRGEKSDPVAPEAALAIFKEDPAFGAFVVLHDLFPTDWRIFYGRFAPELAKPDDQQDWGEVFDFLPAFIQQRQKYVPLASEATLRRMASSHSKLLERIKARSVEACVDFLFYEGSPDTTIEAEALALASVYSERLTAIHEGMTRPARRKGVNEADVVALAQAFKRRGGTAVQWTRIDEGETDKPTAGERCDAWINYYGAMAEAPDGTAGRWASWFFAPEDAGPAPEPEPDSPKPSST